ncbi:hypothetical protein [Bacillus cereus]|uniref:hypothetical protein n=1 Tax=Bacillus cereus TaxID=1396 RepID=UPI0018CD9F55|nr:hypothetical protein [Bacillus cereus]MBG9612208.1 hypothetical protein [Bacillus cereus]
MNAKQLRIQILDVQDLYCQTCSFQSASYMYCYKQCLIGAWIEKAGKSLLLLSGQGSLEKSYRQSEQKWDDLCREAVKLQQTHVTYRAIAKFLECDESTLRKQLTKRGLQFVSRTKSKKL